MKTSNIKAVWFDLGNVLFAFNYNHALKEISKSSPFSYEDILKRVKESGDMILFEMGELSPETYFTQMKDSLQVSLDWKILEKLWCIIFTPIQKNIDLIPQLKEHYKLALVSNTSTSHIKYLKKNHALFSYFDAEIYSFEVGFMKPRKEIFLTALDSFDISPSETIFIDDLAQNIEAAAEFGVQTIHYTGQGLEQYF
tara:strand:- start:223 stop:813 length:591 start_codon:yes stop_codon:yes gene_type:complete